MILGGATLQQLLWPWASYCVSVTQKMWHLPHSMHICESTLNSVYSTEQLYYLISSGLWYSSEATYSLSEKIKSQNKIFLSSTLFSNWQTLSSSWWLPTSAWCPTHNYLVNSVENMSKFLWSLSVVKYCHSPRLHDIYFFSHKSEICDFRIWV